MANTLPIIGTNNLGLTSKLPRWNHQLRFEAGSLVSFDIDTSDTAVNYQLFFNPSEATGPGMESDTPLIDSDWYYLPITTTKPTVP